MKNVLYVGNNLKNNRSNLTGIQILGPLLEKEGYVVFYTSSKSNKLARLLDMIWSCLKRFRSTDVVLIDTYSTQNFYYALIVSQLCRLLGLEYIPVLHGGNLPSRLQRNPKWCRLIFEHAKYNVSPSIYLKSAFETFGLKNLIHIPNTIILDDYVFEAKSFKTPKLLWVRSFSKIYNPMLAVKVFHKVKRSFPDATLCMVGPDADGTQTEVKALTKQLDLEVEFTGKLEKSEWVQLSRDYNIFLNTTNFDNTPVSVIEAMALGLPVVSTNVGGLPYLINDGVDGVLVQPNQVDSMFSAITGILRDNEKRTVIINNARSKVESFDWSHVKHLWLDALDKN